MAFYKTVHLQSGVGYKYHVGKTGIKFSLSPCESYFKTYKQLHQEGLEIKVDKLGALLSMIQPILIKRYLDKVICGIPIPPPRCACGKEDDTVRFQVFPFDSEIYGDNSLHFMCEECASRSAADI
jgi:hypothetical protein